MEKAIYGTPALVLFDKKGNDHKVIAAKPYSADPADAYLMTTITAYGTLSSPFVVHTFNVGTGDFFDGTYCNDLTAALAVFVRR